ncbi:MAG: Peptidyl-prolyl cis-trans isomerase [Parcubacteria group bacterium GW2011_GWB1_40_5]|nr:MAG: Peptidyl-prolyl cis-trans isomerase [Parcubacteria group bacterium GW2011_GWB1_40_5]
MSFVIILAVVFLGYKLFSNKNLDTKNVPVLQETSGAGNNLASSTESSNANQTTIINNVNKKSNMITIDTNYGKIVFETYNADAPKTVENFVTLANKGYYNGVIFHRVIKGFMIQGGDPTGTGAGGPGYQFADELNPNTSSYKAGYKKGVVAMANSGPDTNGSQFFIMTEDYPLPNSYTIFGKVVSGQDVVDAIANVKTGANDKPESPVIMKTVSVQ